MTKIKYPFGLADAKAIASGAVMATSIESNETALTIAQMTADGTLNLSVDSEMPVGSNLTVKVSADGLARTLTPGSGLSGNAQVITANKSFAFTYKFDGATFVHVATQILN